MLTDNMHGLVVNVQARQTDGCAERVVAAELLADAAPTGRRATAGTGRAYDTRGFVHACRDPGVTPHVAQNTARVRGNAIDARTTRHVAYAIGQPNTLTLVMVAYNLTRLRTLAESRPQWA